MIQLVRLRAQGHLDVAKARSVRELGKRHASVLVRAAERLDFVITVVSFHPVMKLMPRKMFDDLGNDNFIITLRPARDPTLGH